VSEHEIVFGGGLTIWVTREIAEQAEPVLAELLQDGVPAKLAAKDATLWGPAAESEASIRLGWVDTSGTAGPCCRSWPSCVRSSATWTTWCWPGWAARRWPRRSSR
jgi:hypothetical protein